MSHHDLKRFQLGAGWFELTRGQAADRYSSEERGFPKI